MTLELENPDDIWEWDIQKLWALYNYLAITEGFKNTKEYQQVKNGWKIQKPIYWLYEPGWYIEYPHAGKAIIQNYGKINITELREEIEHRENIMRQKILQITQTQESIKPR